GAGERTAPRSQSSGSIWGLGRRPPARCVHSEGRAAGWSQISAGAPRSSARLTRPPPAVGRSRAGAGSPTASFTGADDMVLLGRGGGGGRRASLSSGATPTQPVPAQIGLAEAALGVPVPEQQQLPRCGRDRLRVVAQGAVLLEHGDDVAAGAPPHLVVAQRAAHQ